jgi:hypothetical protein
MLQDQFISHAQIVPAPIVPRRGMGIFGALTIVIGILALVLSGGVYLLDKSTDTKVDQAKANLIKIHEQTSIESIKGAQKLADRINTARELLASHTYATKVFEFVEKSTLSSMQINSFSFGGGSVKLQLLAPGYVEYAQQVKYYRSISNIKKFDFPVPSLDKDGQVSFSVNLELNPEYLRSLPEKQSTASNTATGTTTGENL